MPKLKNNIPVIFHNNGKKTPVVEILFNTDTEDENTTGIRHFIEHMFTTGTKSVPTFTDNIDNLLKIGLTYEEAHANTSERDVRFFGRCQSENVLDFINYVTDMLKNNSFFMDTTEDEQTKINKFTHEMGVILHEIDKKNMDANGNPDLSVSGTKDNVKSITPQQIMGFARKHMSPDKCKIQISGDIDDTLKAEIYDMLNKTMGEFKYPEKNFDFKGYDKDKYVPKENKDDVALEIVLPQIKAEDIPAYKVALIHLTKEWQKIREIGVDTGMFGLIYHIFPEQGAKCIKTNTSPDKVYELVARMAKCVYKAAYNFQRDDLEIIRKYAKSIDGTMTPEQIKQICRTYFNGEQLLVQTNNDKYVQTTLKKVWQDNFNANETLNISAVFDAANKKIKEQLNIDKQMMRDNTIINEGR